MDDPSSASHAAASASFANLQSEPHDNEHLDAPRADSSSAAMSVEGGAISQNSRQSQMGDVPLSPFFFADAVLDLSEAHDIAETPEAPSKRQILLQTTGEGATAGTKAGIPPVPLTRRNDEEGKKDESNEGPNRGGEAIARSLTDFGATSAGRTPHNEPSASREPRWSADSNGRIFLPGAPGNGSTSPPSHSTNRLSSQFTPPRPKNPPRWPRDVPWALAFALLVPTVLLGALLASPHSITGGENGDSTSQSSTSIEMEKIANPPLSMSCRLALVGSAASALVLVQLVYGGGRLVGCWGHYEDPSGERRRQRAARILTVHAPVLHVATCLLVAAYVAFGLGGGSSSPGRSESYWIQTTVGVALPLYFCARDLVLFQRFLAYSSSSSLSAYHRRRRSTEVEFDADFYVEPASSSSTSRQAYTQALIEAALDVLSRSLRASRHPPLAPAVALLVLIQAGVLWAWHAAIMACVRALAADGSGGLDRSPQDHPWAVILALVLVAGKWASGTCARFLTYLASGAVSAWFDDHQQQLLAARQRQRQRRELGVFPEIHDINGDPKRYGDDSGGYDERSDMPEAYRTVDASVYQSVLLELDDDDDGVVGFDEDDGAIHNDQFLNDNYPGGAGRGGGPSQEASSRVTVRSLLKSSVAVSLGSVAQCGLLGGIAQYVYSQVRKYHAARTFVRTRQQLYHRHFQQQRSHGGGRRQNNTNGFRSMMVESSDSSDQQRSGGARCCECCCDPRGWGRRLGSAVLGLARGFIRQYSDLAMCHVASHYKNYRRAARDVAALVEASGVEPILEDDITTHICSCAGGAIAGFVLVLSFVIAGGNSHVDGNWAVLANLLLSFYLSYTVLFAALEPLRASIKAVYVSFAQHPDSLSAAFPLIYHRLSRLSGFSNSLLRSSATAGVFSATPNEPMGPQSHQYLHHSPQRTRHEAEYSTVPGEGRIYDGVGSLCVVSDSGEELA